MEKLPFIKRLFGHLKTIVKHRHRVTIMCFKCGLYKQGILHDLSKFSILEFKSGVKYYQGYRSPIDAEREDIGYSLGWLHHEGRNNHHWEHWIDKNYIDKKLYVVKMPLNYILESCIDRIIACKIYQKENYKTDSAYNFLVNGKDKYYMGDENFRRFEILLKYLKDNGEKETIKYYKSLFKKWKKDKNFDI